MLRTRHSVSAESKPVSTWSRVAHQERSAPIPRRETLSTRVCDSNQFNTSTGCAALHGHCRTNTQTHRSHHLQFNPYKPLNDSTAAGRLIDNRCAISRSAGWRQVRRAPPPCRPADTAPIYTDTARRLMKPPHYRPIKALAAPPSRRRYA